MSSEAEVAAVIARLKGDASAPLNVHDSRPASPIYPYVIVYADGGVSSSDREADVRVSRAVTWQTTTVGTSAAQCRSALARVTDRLEDWRPTVAGRMCSKVDHETAQPVRPDDELPDRVVYYATDQWSFVSDPA